MYDPDITTTTAASTIKKGEGKGDKDQGDKINIEIKFKDIDQVDVTSTAAANEKTIVIFTKTPVVSAEGQVLSQSIYFFFSALSNEDVPGGQGGVEDYKKMWKSLESRGLDVVTASSLNNTSDVEDMADDDNDEEEDGDGAFFLTPQKKSSKKKKKGSKDATPVSGPASTVASLLSGEIKIPSSQPRPGKRRRSSQNTSIRGGNASDEEEAEVEQGLSSKKMKVTKKGREINPLMQDLQVKDLIVCLDEFKDVSVFSFAQKVSILN